MTRRAWGGLLVTAAFLWGAAYIAFWYQRSGCFDLFDHACNDAPVAWLERLISFWWVRDYQTLLAGLGATSAIVAVIINRQHDERKESQRARENAQTACTLAANRFRDAAVFLQSRDVNEQEHDLSVIAALAPDLARIDMMLAAVVQAASRDVSWALRRLRIELAQSKVDPRFFLGESQEVKEPTIMAGHAYAIVQILEFVADNVDSNGRYNFKGMTEEVPPGHLGTFLMANRLNKHHLGVLHLFMRWDDSAH